MKQFDFSARGWQPTDPNVLGYLKIGMIEPDRRRLTKEPLGGTLSKLRYEVQAAGDQAADVLDANASVSIAEGTPFEYPNRCDVHRRSLRLDMQERSVKRGERDPAGHHGVLSWRSRADRASLPSPHLGSR